MEKKTMSFIVVCVMIGSLSGESRADLKKFKNCMGECLLKCAFTPWAPICPASCLAKCLVHQAEPPASSSPARFCTLGCATSICSKLITKYNPHLDKVESCVKQCSGSCKNDYVSSAH